MIMPVGAESLSEGIQMCAEIYQQLKKTLAEKEYAPVWAMKVVLLRI